MQKDITINYITNINEEDYNDNPEASNSGLLKILCAKKAGKVNRTDSKTLQKINLAQKQKAVKQKAKAKAVSGFYKSKEKAINIDITDSDDKVMEVEGNVCETNKHNEETSPSIDVRQVWLAFMRHVLAPIVEEREMQKWFNISAQVISAMSGLVQSRRFKCIVYKVVLRN